ncbi:MAG: DUF2059 domain-containing protein [Bacteroidota bacterium]
MKIIAMVMFSLLLTIANLHAQNLSSKNQKINELIQLIGSKDQYDNFINTGMKVILKKYENNLTESDVAILKQGAIDLVDTFLKNDLRNIYAKFLTEAEVCDLIDFYKSETGQRFRKIQPMIGAEIQEVIMTKYVEDFKIKLQNQLMAKK